MERERYRWIKRSLVVSVILCVTTSRHKLESKDWILDSGATNDIGLYLSLVLILKLMNSTLHMFTMVTLQSPVLILKLMNMKRNKLQFNLTMKEVMTHPDPTQLAKIKPESKLQQAKAKTNSVQNS